MNSIPEHPELLGSPIRTRLAQPGDANNSLKARLNGIIDQINDGFDYAADAISRRTDIRNVGDIGRVVMARWQSRDRETSWLEKRPWLRRTATALGSAALLTTATTLASRGAQAYAMARHGMHFGFEHIPNPVEGFLPADTDTSTNQIHTMTSDAAPPTSNKSVGRIAEILPAKNASSGGQENASDTMTPIKEVNYYGGVRIETEDYADQYRTAESWATDKDCAWRWAQQDIAEAGHRAGLSDNQIHTIAHNEQLISKLTNHYINTNSSIRNAPNNWLYDGQTYNTAPARAEAESIIRQHFPNAPGLQPEQSPTEPEVKPVPPSPENPDLKDTSDHAKDAAKDTDNFIEAIWNDLATNISRGAKEAWRQFNEDDWLKVILGVGTLAAYAAHDSVRRKRPNSRPLDPLYKTKKTSSPLDSPHARHSYIPPLTNRGRFKNMLSDLQTKIANRRAARAANRDTIPINPTRPPHSKDPAKKS